MSTKTPEPHEVFTPRAPDINQRTYVERPALERKLINALKGDKYIILHGESGNGKTWLYKKVLKQLSLRHEIINLANLHMGKSLSAVLSNKLGDLGSETVASSKTEADAGIRPWGVGGGVKKITEYMAPAASPFARLVQEMNITARGKRSVLVLDNFEQIIENDDYVREVASLIISADEEVIAKSGVKVLIVGTPSNIKQMISKVSNATTISNRLVEIPEVARLEVPEALLIMSQGFEVHLKFTSLISKVEMYRDICWKTDRIAQHIQELCLAIALGAKANKGVLTHEVVQAAEREWVGESLSSDSAIIEAVMSPQDSKIGRKNQVLYCLGHYSREDFRVPDIEKAVREKFEVRPEVALNVAPIFSTFAKAENPIIRRTPARGVYRFASPKLKMVIRAGLKLNDEQRVIKTWPHAQ
jgi:hypothetical protein